MIDIFDAAVAAAIAKGSGGGSGGTTDYDDLSNKPEINGNQLVGDKSSSNLGLQSVIDSTHKLDADLIDDSTSTNKLAHIDNAGGLRIGSTQYIKIMDSASYAALTTKDDMLYMVYPTPSANLSMSASPRTGETLETPTEREDIRLEPMEGVEAKIGEENELTVEGGDEENADLQRDNGADEMR